MDITNAVVNGTNIDQSAGPRSILTAAVVNTNDISASQNAGLSPFLYPPSFGIANGVVNATNIDQSAGPGSVLTAAVVNTNDISASQKQSLYPVPYFYFPLFG